MIVSSNNYLQYQCAQDGVGRSVGVKLRAPVSPCSVSLSRDECVGVDVEWKRRGKQTESMILVGPLVVVGVSTD